VFARVVRGNDGVPAFGRAGGPYAGAGLV